MPVTIAIPFYNAEEFLADAIRSVFAQTYTDWELILLDDGSTDNSLEIARSVKDSRVRVISDGKNIKLAARLNQITYLAKYDLIARMDADDLMSPDRIKKQILILEENQGIDLVSTGLFSVTDKLKLVGSRWHNRNTISLKGLLEKKGCGVVHAAIIARKSWYQRNKYDTSLKLAQDYELWIRAAAKNDFNIFLLQEPLYFYREEGSISIKKMNAARKIERLAYRKYGKWKILQLLFKSYGKQLGANILFKLNIDGLLLKRRNSKKENPKLVNLFHEGIEIVLKAKVPGFN